MHKLGNAMQMSLLKVVLLSTPVLLEGVQCFGRVTCATQHLSTKDWKMPISGELEEGPSLSWASRCIVWQRRKSWVTVTGRYSSATVCWDQPAQPHRLVSAFGQCSTEEVPEFEYVGTSNPV